MMKKAFLLLAVVLSTALFMACNNTPASNDTASAPVATSGDLRLAYVEIDSISTQYTFAVEAQEALATKAQNIQNTISAKEQQVNAALAKLQQDVQSNALTEDEAQQRYNNIMQQGNDAQALAQRLSNELQAEQVRVQTAITDSIQHYLNEYNKDKHYAFIFTDATLLYANTSYNITDEVIAGLNKCYKPSKKDKETKKKSAKK